MASRECVGCGILLTNDVITREHILPRWLAEELHLPRVSYKHYRHDEDAARDELVRSHDLGSLAIKNVCSSCNNGWMASLEGRAKPTLLGLLNMKTTLLQMTEQERATVAAWAIKTAFMIASAQPDISGLPWYLFRGLARTPEQIPDECPVVAGQQDFLDGFMHSSRTDLSSSNGQAIQARVGFSIRKLHFVVVIPFTAGQRMVRTSGVHLPIWPLESEILVRYAFFPTFSSPNDLINYLVDQVECGLFPDKK
jgi:hypothetical protein